MRFNYKPDRSVHFMVTSELLEDIRTISKQHHQSISSWVRNQVRQSIQDYKRGAIEKRVMPRIGEKW
jgi:hypothetical protein